jgi:hypothetical protein
MKRILSIAVSPFKGLSDTSVMNKTLGFGGRMLQPSAMEDKVLFPQRTDAGQILANAHTHNLCVITKYVKEKVKLSLCLTN